MIGNVKRNIPELITPAEAVSLTREYATSQEILAVIEIEREYRKHPERNAKNPRDLYMILLTTCYNAGRIQGIREERQRRKTAH